jgi:hypothetical protein
VSNLHFTAARNDRTSNKPGYKNDDDRNFGQKYHSNVKVDNDGSDESYDDYDDCEADDEVGEFEFDSAARNTSDGRAEQSFDRTLENKIEKNAREFNKAGNDGEIEAKKARIFSTVSGEKRVHKADVGPESVSKAALTSPKSLPLSDAKVLREPLAPGNNENSLEMGQTQLPSDSGYASLTQTKLEYLENVQATTHMEAAQSVHLGPAPTEGHHDTNFLFENAHDVPLNEDDDTHTLYSDTSSVALVTKKVYLSELADNLFGKVNSKLLDDSTMERICSGLPKLLKSFALKIGHDAPSQMHRDVMYFVHKYRQ